MRHTARPTTLPRSIGIGDAQHWRTAAWGSAVASAVAVVLLVMSFGILSFPVAVGSLLLAVRARRELPPVTSQRLATVAWWSSIVVLAVSAAALLVLALDLVGAGAPGEGVEEAR